MSTGQIEQLHTKISDSIFTIEPKLAYSDLAPAFIELCSLVEAEDSEDETIWYIGEFGHCSLMDLIIGAYWHYTEWHDGQSSQSYAALCALGSIFSPGMVDGPEPDSSESGVYNMLDVLAQSFFEGIE